jgi:hypothetical protein
LWVAFFVALGIGARFFVLVAALFGADPGVQIGCCGGCALFSAGYLVCFCLLDARATEISPKYTLRRAVLAATTFRDYVDAGYEYSREDIARRVKEIIADSLGVKEEMLTDNTSFAEDIGAD